jgi:hypothetical protein
MDKLQFPHRVRLLGVACLALGGLWGCELNAADTPASSQTSVDPPTIGPITNLQRTAIGLYGEQGTIWVGDSWTDAESAMPEPKGASEFADLPARFQKPYQGRGWEATDRGFGVIMFEDRIAVAMIQNERASQDDYASMTKWYEQQLPKATTDTVVTGDLRYRFWEQDGQRAMVLAESRPDGNLYLSTAMGDHRVMDALGMTAEAARHDGKVVLRILDDRKRAKEKERAAP